MKKILLACTLFVFANAHADEGMWLPNLIGQQKYAEMKAKGLKLTADQLFSINHSSLKDAILIFGGGCTGEVVSKEGLVFTNHHCGYDVIAKASTLEHNYLQDGFYAKNHSEEIPGGTLSVQFLVKIDDVSKQVQDSMKLYPNYADWQLHRDAVYASIGKASVAGTSYEARVYSMFKDNQFLLYTFSRYKDIRLVGAPAESVGKFGGDTDNWEWPRHTGDFSIFRIYANPDGSPADYNDKNVPLKPKYYLPVSLKGIKEGDFTMIFGYPGGTNRFETSYGVRLATDIKNPAFVQMRDIRLKAMFAEMIKDPATKLQLASSYAGLANYWKFYDGETKQLLKYDVYTKKKTQEDMVANWAKGKAGYDNLWADYARAYAAWEPYAKQKEYYEQGIIGAALPKFASKLYDYYVAKNKPGAADSTLKRLVKNLDKDRTQLMKEINRPSELNMMAGILQAYYKGIDKDQWPISYFSTIKSKYGDLKDEDTYKKYAGYLFSNTVILDDARWATFMGNPNAYDISNDPAFEYIYAFRSTWDTKYKPLLTRFNDANAELGNKYLKAWLEMNPKKAMYPDANFSMRISFGNVKSYRPKDATFYDYYCTSKGLLEKYIPGNYEFDLPKKQIELLKNKDFGRYMDASKKDLVVTFITTDDITGGNSGSPVINASGELIGLAFDGNYEALSHKINFDKDMCRTIVVDIRYVLWCIDKLGGAPNIVNELKLVTAGK